MRLTKTLVSTAAVAVGLLVSVGNANAAGQGVVASAGGAGHIEILGSLRTFAFTAHTDASGVSYGQAQIHNRDQDIVSHFVLDCLHVSGNVATASGTVSSSSNPDIIGTRWIFRAVDNGEGKKATAPDQISLAFRRDAPCENPGSLPLSDVQQGNIQVR